MGELFGCNARLLYKSSGMIGKLKVYGQFKGKFRVEAPNTLQYVCSDLDI